MAAGGSVGSRQRGLVGIWPEIWKLLLLDFEHSIEGERKVFSIACSTLPTSALSFPGEQVSFLRLSQYP